jgi:hypothetical protein
LKRRWSKEFSCTLKQWKRNGVERTIFCSGLSGNWYRVAFTREICIDSKWKPIAVVSILKMNYCQCFNQHPIDINKIKCLSLLYTSIQISLVKATRYQFPDKPLQNIVLSTPFRFNVRNNKRKQTQEKNKILSAYSVAYS